MSKNAPPKKAKRISECTWEELVKDFGKVDAKSILAAAGISKESLKK